MIKNKYPGTKENYKEKKKKKEPWDKVREKPYL